ncbi:hypothetical protein PTTG_00687 [Puccinia triticina 1-1 BBBD Race 1]|uniref:Uncharacterized protein n=1 Tax=Puccinia triticina (isolate 1-1 / race 1 (BBBD)) TaxID=630390 RepID=A0A180G6E9_PUCT1|nr:hypothetical protein PTTG_00687 [Puccinia triticina 1-1 BBBD Race 1]
MQASSLLNVSLPTTSTTTPVMPSYRVPSSAYHHQPARPSANQLVFAAQSTGSPSALRDGDLNRPGADPPLPWTYTAPLSAPTSVTLTKRQVVLEIEVITVVNVIPKDRYPNASPVAVTVTVPPPTNTMISNGGWPIINPGSTAACWSDMACNSVCPNFQQNGWYAHCMDAACTQCRCQIISPSMCSGQAWSNATWASTAPARTVQINPAVATVTVVVAQAGPSLFDQMSRRNRWIGLMLLSLSLSAWLVS